MTHRWDAWSAAFLYRGFIGSTRRCMDCSALERAVFGGFPDERRNRIARYLTARLAR